VYYKHYNSIALAPVIYWISVLKLLATVSVPAITGGQFVNTLALELSQLFKDMLYAVVLVTAVLVMTELAVAVAVHFMECQIALKVAPELTLTVPPLVTVLDSVTLWEVVCALEIELVNLALIA